MNYSASQKRFLDTTSEISETDREQQYADLERQLVKDAIRVFPASYGRRVIAKDESQHPFSESHYDRCWINLLHSLERQGKIIPGKTYLLEVTSGSAGRSLGNIARLLGYHTTIVVPPLDPARRVGVAEAADEVVDSAYPEEMLAGAVRTFRERIGTVTGDAFRLSKEAKMHIAQRVLGLPNHSKVEETPATFEAIGEECVTQIHNTTHIGAFVGAIGNGTTIKGILNGLRKSYGHDVPFYGYTGPRELFGAGGTKGVDFRFVNELREQGIIRKDNTFCVTPEEWEQTFEEINRGQPRELTIGRTSAMSIALARKLIEESKGEIGDVMTVIYDKADQYGNHTITDPHAMYVGNGDWRSSTT
ncbi:MAG: pyridoxal-phosphate dependent enzyme [Candidatus Peribacteraceae bacterium]|nr:pyridoxal-phosphate dependent enzyme [Candidatus Peribacteraceae bacterium]